MCDVAVKIPDAVMYDTKRNQRETSAFVKRSVALAYYLQDKVSIGYCAEIAGLTEAEFIDYLGQNHISIFRFDDEADLDEDIKNVESCC